MKNALGGGRCARRADGENGVGSEGDVVDRSHPRHDDEAEERVERREDADHGVRRSGHRAGEDHRADADEGEDAARRWRHRQTL